MTLSKLDFYLGYLALIKRVQAKPALCYFCMKIQMGVVFFFDGWSAFVGTMEDNLMISLLYLLLTSVIFYFSVCVIISVPRNKGRKIIKPLKNLLNIHNNMPVHGYLEQEVSMR